MKDKIWNLRLYIIIVIIVLFGAFLVYKFAFAEEDYTNLVSISLNELETKLDNKETFILVISQTGCSHCQQYLPELDRTLKTYSLTANVLNITDLSEDESNTLSQHFNFSGTPTTIFIHDGEEKTTLNRLVGYASKAKVVERLKALEYIK